MKKEKDKKSGSNKHKNAFKNKGNENREKKDEED
jgi:hypothetical protein